MYWENFINLKYHSHFNVKFMLNASLDQGDFYKPLSKLCINIHMDINALSDRPGANLVFCLHRQFLNRSDIDHLSI